jgi:hypothetical protein
MPNSDSISQFSPSTDKPILYCKFFIHSGRAKSTTSLKVWGSSLRVLMGTRDPPDLPAGSKPDDERYSNEGQNNCLERTSAPCRSSSYAGVVVPLTRR